MFATLKELAYTIKPDKSDEFLKKLYETAPSKSDWEKIKLESQICDKARLEALFAESEK